MRKIEKNPYVIKRLKRTNLKKLSHLVKCFLADVPFAELMKLSNLQEGDVIRLFRRVLDILRQLSKASDDQEFSEHIALCINEVNKEYIQFEL